jgi:hypothetical protein
MPDAPSGPFDIHVSMQWHFCVAPCTVKVHRTLRLLLQGNRGTLTIVAGEASGSWCQSVGADVDKCCTFTLPGGYCLLC